MDWRASLTYFGAVFAVGFVLGTVRVLVVVPALGERGSELLEAPLMLLACFLAARWIVRRFRLPPGARSRIPVGFLALALLLAAELLLVVLVRGVSLDDYIMSRDPISGVVYLASLLLFALMPWLLGGIGADGGHPDPR